jgi:nucleoside-diphosphate-sugar epimerase
MKAILTGSTGFIGTNLKKHLQSRGWSVQAISRGTSLEKMTSLFHEFKPDVVFHLASLFIAEHQTSEVEPLIESNILFGTKLLEAMKVAGIQRFVNTGTAWQHYNNQDNEPVCLYAATKTAFEEIIRFYVSSEKLKSITLKIFDTYGPGDPRPKLIPKLLENFKASKPLELSEGQQRLDFVHVADIVRAFEVAALRLINDKSLEGSMDSYALSSGSSLSLRELIAKLENLKGQKFSVNWGARPYRKREVMTPWSRGASLPGWRAEISLDQGLRELIGGS